MSSSRSPARRTRSSRTTTRRRSRSPWALPGAAAASPCRAASSWRSAAASGSRRSSGAPARAWSRSGRRTGPVPPTSRRPLGRGQREARPARPSLELHARAGSSRRRTRPSSRGSPTRMGRSSSTTWAAARCSTRRRSGSRTSRRPRERLAAGADLVTFCGDKLARRAAGGAHRGPRGPRRRASGSDPLARAMRPDKVMLAALAATLRLYRAGRAHDEIPVWRQPRRAVERLRERAERDRGHGRGRRRRHRKPPSVAGRCRARPCPRWRCASVAAAPERLLGAPARRASPRSSAGSRVARVLLDLRTIDPAEDDAVAAAVRAALAEARRQTVVVGTAGHIDHGKTSLLRALTGIDADRLPEEQRRGHDDRRRLRPPGVATTATSSTSSTCPATTGSSATCSSARARSMPRCSSSPPTTVRARRPSSTSSCSTRWESVTGWPSSPRRTSSTPRGWPRCSPWCGRWSAQPGSRTRR